MKKELGLYLETILFFREISIIAMFFYSCCCTLYQLSPRDQRQQYRKRT